MVMSKSVSIKARINAIAKCLQNGESPRDFIPKITKKYKVSRETVNKDIRKARVAAQEAQQARQKAELEAGLSHAAEAERRRLLTRDEKREILAQIASGELEIHTRRPVWNSSEKKFVMVPFVAIPEATDRMKAIDLDNKMEGDYAPVKQEHSGGLSFGSFLKKASQKKNVKPI